MAEEVEAITSTFDLKTALAALNRDYSSLTPRLRELSHAVVSDCAGLTIRLYYPSFRQNKATVVELVDVIALHILNFCLPRNQINSLNSVYGKISASEFALRLGQLVQKATDLFKRAHIASNRNGEAGELLLFLLTEWVLEAPQIIAKMSLKTNREMPVHGSDGVHARFCPKTKRLFLYWGESKLHKNVKSAIESAANSIATALTNTSIKHEIGLIQRDIDLSGLPQEAKEELLRFLDPFEEAYNDRHDVVTCLIAFDFDGFLSLSEGSNECEIEFQQLVQKNLESVVPQISAALKSIQVEKQPIEIFLVPIPSVEQFRQLFQDKIGWKANDSKSG